MYIVLRHLSEYIGLTSLYLRVLFPVILTQTIFGRGREV